jgi:hypothetical protein
MQRRTLFATSAALLAAALVSPGPAGADHLPPQASPQGYAAAHTHGPDTVELDRRGRRPSTAPGAPYEVDSYAPWTSTQYDGKTFTADQPDLTTLPTIHAIYLYPRDRSSRFTRFAAMFQADARFASQRLANLYGRGIRLDERSGSNGVRYLDITAVQSTKNYRQLSSSTQFNVVREELRSRGYLSNPNKKYLVWLDAGSSYCGQGELYHDTRRSSANYNERTTLAVVYRPYSTTDASGGFCRGRTVDHEVGHNLGALQKVAPHAFDGAHCNDSAEDVMCYRSSSTPDTGGQAFDWRNDDYWDPAANPSSGSVVKLAWWTVNLSRFVCPSGGCSLASTPSY